AQPAPVGGDGTGGEYQGGRAGRPGGPARGSPAGGGQSAHLDPGRAGPHLGPHPGSRGRAPRLRDCRGPRGSGGGRLQGGGAGGGRAGAGGGVGAGGREAPKRLVNGLGPALPVATFWADWYSCPV